MSQAQTVFVSLGLHETTRLVGVIRSQDIRDFADGWISFSWGRESSARVLTPSCTDGQSNREKAPLIRPRLWATPFKIAMASAVGRSFPCEMHGLFCRLVRECKVLPLARRRGTLVNPDKRPSFAQVRRRASHWPLIQMSDIGTDFCPLPSGFCLRPLKLAVA